MAMLDLGTLFSRSGRATPASRITESVIEARAARTFEPLVGALSSAAESVNLAEPDTSLDVLRRRLEPVFARWANGPRLPLLLRWCLHWFATPAGARFFASRNRDRIREVRRELRPDRRSRALLRLVRRADKLVPYAASIAFADLLPNPRSARAEIAAAMQVANLERLTGEVRARACVEAFLGFSETHYKRYLRFLHRLVFLAEGRQPPVPDMIGQLSVQIQAKIGDAPDLVHHDVRLLRNAAAHRHYHYDSSTDSLVFTVPDHPVTTWPVDRVIAVLADMAKLSGDTAYGVGGVYFKRDILWRSGVGRVIAEQLANAISNDSARRGRAGAAIFAHVETTFQPLFDLERLAGTPPGPRAEPMALSDGAPTAL